MKTIRGTVCVSVVCNVPDALFEKRQKEYEADGMDEKSVLHDFLCEAGPAQTFEACMGPNEETDWVEFFCDSNVDENGIFHDEPEVEDA